nr:MAG TPA: hypothetical protein [Caudoviricetes sp.]
MVNDIRRLKRQKQRLIRKMNIFHYIEMSQ